MIKPFFAYSGRWTSIQTHALNNFSLVHVPPNQWQGSGVRTPGPPPPPPQTKANNLIPRPCAKPPPPHGPLSVRTWPFSSWHASAENFGKFDFFRNPFVVAGVGLGGHLATIQVLGDPRIGRGSCTLVIAVVEAS